jgi:hypothetical protein
MTIDIPDEWIRRVLNAHPDTPAAEAVRNYLRARDGDESRKMLLLAIGERALHEMALQT